MRMLKIARSSIVGYTVAAVTLAIVSSTSAKADELLISKERCELNKAAGQIIYLTTFAYAATVSVLDPVVADELGYFKSLCLDVKLQPGLDNVQLVSAGRAQIAGLGNPSVVMTGIANNAEIVGIATYANTPALEIITMEDGPIKSLKDLEGKTLGYKAAIAPQISAMLEKAGVDASKVHQVSVGFDPHILPNGTVDALLAYKSNEPLLLRSEGFSVKEWDPAKYGIKASFNTFAANRDFAQKHPTAVEDFLRASFHAYDWINKSEANLDEALGYAAKRSTAGYDLKISKARWQAEVTLVKESQVPGTPLGWQSAEQWKPEAEMLTEYNLVKQAPDVSTAQTNAFVAAIYKDGALIWPAP